MKNFILKLVRFYGIALVISLLACWGTTWAVFEALDLMNALYIGREIWFEAALATAEVLTCAFAVEKIRAIIVPFTIDDEEDPVFDIEGL